MSKRMMRTGLVAAGAVALVAAGCGNDADDSGDAAVEDAAVDEAVEDAADDAGGDEVVVRGVDFAFEGLPDTVGVGTEISFVNDSDVEAHELVAIRIQDDVELSVEEALELPDEATEFTDDVIDQVFSEFAAPGPPAMVHVAAPGEAGEVVVGDGAFSEPGRYAVFCTFPTGADPDELFAAFAEVGEGPPDLEGLGGEPHFVHGMFAELTVE